MKTFSRFAILALAILVAGCDKVPLLAPTSSTISVSAPTRVLPLGGSVEVTAMVLEQSGTPVQNGTTVLFTTSLGSVSPVEAQTRNGQAVTTWPDKDSAWRNVAEGIEKIAEEMRKS